MLCAEDLKEYRQLEHRRAYGRRWQREHRKTAKGKARVKALVSRRRAIPGYNMLAHAKQRAKKLKLPCDLDLAYVQSLIPTTCPVFGTVLCVGEGRFQDNSPSLDRIDPHKGYVRGNVQVISWRANNLKADGTLAEFEALIAHMRQHVCP